MEKMLEAMLKGMGFDPAKVKTSIDVATKEFAEMKAQLNRIEALLVAQQKQQPALIENTINTDA